MLALCIEGVQCQREEDKKRVLGLKKYYLFLFLIVCSLLAYISNTKVVLLFLYFVLWCKGNTWVFGPHIVGSSPAKTTRRCPLSTKDR